MNYSGPWAETNITYTVHDPRLLDDLEEDSSKILTGVRTLYMSEREEAGS